MAITAGTYKARVTGECVLGVSKNKGTPFIEFYLTILEGDNKGGRARWTGYFTENTNERSIKSLQICGWRGEDLEVFADGALHGLDDNDVEIVVEMETYTNDEGEDRTAPRVAWINKPGGFLNTSAKMAPGAAASFGAKMRGLVLATAAKSPPAPAKPKPTPTPVSSQATPVAEPDDGIPF